jgi:hypothetical protein
MKHIKKSQNSSTPLFTLDDGQEIGFEDLLKKIYTNSEEKNNNITATAQKVISLVKTLSDMVVMMPILVDMQKTSIQNDDLLVKMAAIVQRSQNAKAKDAGLDDSLISEEDRKMLMEAAKAAREIPGSSASGD